MSAKLSRIRVLLVDDHHFMRTIWRSLFMGFGMKDIIEAGDAATAFEVLNNEEVDIIVVDYHMDGLNGAEFIKLLRCSQDTNSTFVPIIGCTADTRRTVITEMVNAGVDEVLAKPVSAQLAWAKFHAVAERRRSFVRSRDFFGPDRRRRTDPKFRGANRRDTVDI